MNLSNVDRNKAVLTNGEVIELPYAWLSQLEKEIINWRKEMAKIVELPAYCIFPNSTLKNLMKVLPRRKNELWLVGGFSSILVDTYGDEICFLIDDFLNKKNIAEIMYGFDAIDVGNTRVRAIIGYLGLDEYFIQREETVKEFSETTVIQNQEIKNDSDGIENCTVLSCQMCRYHNKGCGLNLDNVCPSFELKYTPSDYEKKQQRLYGDSSSKNRFADYKSALNPDIDK